MTSAFRDIVLAGGGHTHALLIKRWGMQAMPGVRLTLISPEPLTPYSGMLPGFLAGHYAYTDMHIDLVQLCQWAGVRLILDRVTGLDAAKQEVQLAQHPDLAYDLLSFDIGATPAQTVPGVAEFAQPVKPIAGFIRHWLQIQQQLRAADTCRQLVIVGGGAGSVELALALAHAVQQDVLITCKPQLTLVTRNSHLLETYPAKVSTTVLAHCNKLGITVLTGFDVSEVQHNVLLAAHGNRTQHFDYLLWCTQAGAAPWLQHSGLALNAQGFIQVNRYLQSSNCPAVFAAGDIAHMLPAGLPKAGVYAVRQAPILFNNLRHALLGETLQEYKPQHHFLSLLALGDKTAVGSRGRFAASGAWVWRWKNHIDQRFMDKFRALPAQPMCLVLACLVIYQHCWPAQGCPYI